jgi:hypothetical protein
MLIARYRHRLPADYAMDRIRSRVAERAPAWERLPGLIFKAVLIAEQARGAPANAYSSLYLWRDADAAAEFLAGPAFRAVVESFGRPRVETWLPNAVAFGGATSALVLAEETRLIAPQEDLATLRETEQAWGRDMAGQRDVLAAAAGLAPDGWRVTRFTLRPAPVAAAAGVEIAHLSSPGLAALRGV